MRSTFDVKLASDGLPVGEQALLQVTGRERENDINLILCQCRYDDASRR